MATDRLLPALSEVTSPPGDIFSTISYPASTPQGRQHPGRLDGLNHILASRRRVRRRGHR